MEKLFQQTNKSLLELHNCMSTLTRSGFSESSAELEKETEDLLYFINENCKKLDDYLFKEPSHRKQASKLKIDQIKYDIRHIESSYRNYRNKKRAYEEEERRREELMSMTFKTNAEQNDTKIAMDYALQHHDALQNADKNIGQMLYTGSTSLEHMRNQRASLKGVRKRMLDIGNTLGLSNTVMRLIDKRGSQDKWIVYGGILLTCVIMFLTVKYLR